ncbi:MAG: Gfo/Idh/MocA family oxidoreductase, partial [Phycisphaerae bacterium]|nr:Gfo/Idh/MocA family oxidoreductase [Phycisphaerae bacterium]MDW8262832.1 Gfo/Idh/MocA family oxidoreductase [Phycisphaerales bacterium]
LDEPEPAGAYAVTHRRLWRLTSDADTSADVEDSAFALLRFKSGASLELAASFALNQPPQQQGLACRVFGDAACVDVYTSHGALIHRQFDPQGQSKPTPLRPPRLEGYPALLRHFRECILGKAQPCVGPAQGISLMKMIDALYKSAESGKATTLG